MEFGANLDLQDHDQWTPLHMAAACGSAEIVKFLLEVRPSFFFQLLIRTYTFY